MNCSCRVGRKNYNLFHVSCLKNTLGKQVTTLAELLSWDEGQLVLVPEEVLEVRERRLLNRVIQEYLIKWKDLPAEDATWEGDQILQHPNLKFLEDKQSREGKTVMSLSK